MSNGIYWDGASTYFEPEDLQIHQLSSDELITIAKRLPRAAALLYLARVSLAMEAEGKIDSRFHFTICQHLFPANVVEFLSRREGAVWMITPLHLRIVIWLLLAYGSSDEQIIVSDSEVRTGLGVLLTHCRAALTPALKEYGQADPLRWPSAELQLVHHGYRRTMRSFEEISVKGLILIRLLKDLSLEAIFEKAYGFKADELQTVVTAIWLHFENQTSLYFQNVSDGCLNFNYMMGQLGISRNCGEYLVANLIRDLHVNDLDTNSRVVRMEQLADRPLGLFNGALCCLDLDFLRSKVARVLWNLCSSLAISHRIGAFTGEAGGVFEEYCNSLLTAGTSQGVGAEGWLAPSELLVRAPADGLLVQGGVAVIFEFKSSPLGPGALFATDPSKLAEAIDKKFIFGSDGDPQGFIQCRNHLRKMISRAAEFHLEGVDTIIPCLITMEDAMTWKPCFSYVRETAKQLFSEFGGLVVNPVIMHAEDLGLLAERTSMWGLPSMILEISGF